MLCRTRKDRKVLLAALLVVKRQITSQFSSWNIPEMKGGYLTGWAVKRTRTSLCLGFYKTRDTHYMVYLPTFGYFRGVSVAIYTIHWASGKSILKGLYCNYPYQRAQNPWTKPQISMHAELFVSLLGVSLARKKGWPFFYTGKNVKNLEKSMKILGWRG